MNPSGVIVTSVGTLVVGVLMAKTIHMSNKQKTEIKEKLPSVREATLASVKKTTKHEVQTDSSSTTTTTTKAEKPNTVPRKETNTTTANAITTVAKAEKPNTVPRKETNTTTANAITTVAKAEKPNTVPRKETNTTTANTNSSTIPVTAAKNTPARVSSSSSSSAIKKESTTSTRGVPKSAEKNLNKNRPLDAVFTWIRSHPFATAGAVAATTLTLFKLVDLYRKQMIKKEIMMTDDSETLHLYVAPPSFTFPKVARSSIVLKTFLQLANIPYKEYILTNPSYSPIGCLPFIRYKGRCETSVIVAIEYLTAEFDVKMDHCITDKEKAVGDAVVAMLEYSKGIMQDHSIYMNCNHHVNNTTDNTIHNRITPYAKVLQAVKKTLTPVLDWISTTMRKWTTMNETSLRETKDRELQILREFQSVEHIIGKKSFLLSALPTTYDCAVYAVLQPIFAADDISHFTESLMYVRHSDVLSRYVNRVSHAVFPDLHRPISLNASRSNNGSRESSVVY